MKELVGLEDSKGNPLSEGDTITNGRAIFIIVWQHFAWYLKRTTGEGKFLYELAEVIQEKYWKI